MSKAQSGEATPKVKNIYQRMIDVQLAVATVMKNETVKMNENDRGYKAVTHDDVAAALHEPLAKAGIVLLPDITDFTTTEFEVEKQGYGNRGPYKQRWYRTDIKVCVKWINADQPDDFIQSNGAAFALDTSDKSFAKAYSLALKIVLLKVHLLESRDGEEQRPFDQDTPPPEKNSKPAQNQNRNQNPPAKSQPPKSQNNPPQSGTSSKPMANPPASAEQLHDLTELMNARGVTDDHIRSFVMTGYALKAPAPGVPFPLPKAVVDDILGLLADVSSNSETLEAAAKIKAAEREQKAAPTKKNHMNEPDPGEYIIPIGAEGGDVKGKMVKQLGEQKLREVFKFTVTELKKVPKPKNIGELFATNTNIKAFFKGMDIELGEGA